MHGCTDIVCSIHIAGILSIAIWFLLPLAGHGAGNLSSGPAGQVGNRRNEANDACLRRKNTSIQIDCVTIPNFPCPFDSTKLSYILFHGWSTYPFQRYPPQKYEEGLIRETNRTH